MGGRVLDQRADHEEALQLPALLRREQEAVRGLHHGPAGGLGRGALLAGLQLLRDGAGQVAAPDRLRLSDGAEVRVRARPMSSAVRAVDLLTGDVLWRSSFC